MSTDMRPRPAPRPASRPRPAPQGSRPAYRPSPHGAQPVLERGGDVRGRSRDAALMRAALGTLGARVVTTFATVAMLAIAAAALRTEQLGVVAVLTLLTVFLGFGDFGLGTLLLTRLPAARARGDEAAAREVVATTLATLLATGAVIGLGGALTCTLVPWPQLLGTHDVSDGQVHAAVVAFFVSGGLAIPAAVGGRVLAAALRTAQSQLWLAAGAVLATIATAACAALGLGPWAYVLAIAGVPAAVAAVQTWWVLYRALPTLRPRSLRVPLGRVSGYLRAASLYAVMSVSAVLAYAIDALVVAAVLDARAAAVFAVAARLFSLVGTTIGIAGQQLWSALTDAVTRGDLAWARSRYANVLAVSTALTAGASVLLVVAGRSVIRWWVGADLVPPMSLLVAFAVYTVLSTATLQASYLLAAVERVREIAIIGAVMAAVNVLASVALTRAVGLSGPVLGSIVGLALVMIAPLAVLTVRQLRAFEPVPAR